MTKVYINTCGKYNLQNMHTVITFNVSGYGHSQCENRVISRIAFGI